MDNNLVLVDVETRTTWPQLYAMANQGPRQGECLEIGRNTVDTTYDLWKKMHPETLVMSNQNEAKTDVKPEWYGTNPYASYWDTSLDPVNPIWRPDDRMHKKTIVYGIHADGESAVVTPSKPVTRLTIGQSDVIVFYDEPSFTCYAFENNFDGATRSFVAAEASEDGIPQFRDTNTGTVWRIDGIAVSGESKGARMAQMPGLWVYWFAWASFFPDTRVLN